MKIEIVKDGCQGDSDQVEVQEKTAEEASTGGGRKKKSHKILAELRKALVLAITAAVVVVAAPPVYRLCRKWAAERAEEKASAEDLYRRRVYAQRRLGGFRLRAPLFGPSDWNRTFQGDEANRWKRIAAAFENRRWAEAVPLLLGKTPPPPYSERFLRSRKPPTSRPFPSIQDIDRARDVLVAELDARGRFLSGIQSLAGDLHPSPRIRVSDSAAPFVSGVEVSGRGVAELRLDLERKDWLGLANRLLDAKNELFPPFEPVHEKLRGALAKTEAFLVCRSAATNADLRILFLSGNATDPPRILPLRDRLPDGSGWMLPWDLHVRDAFVLTPEMARVYSDKLAEMRTTEAKRLDGLAMKLRLGSVSQNEYERERANGGAVEKAFLEWARSGKPEEEESKNALASAETVFAPLGRPNRVYANGALAGTSPRFIPLGAKGRDWKKMVGLHATKDWAGIIRTLGASAAEAPPDARAVQEARSRFSAFRINVRLELAEQDEDEEPDIWVAEMLPSDLEVFLKSKTDATFSPELIPARFAGEVEPAEPYPDGSGYVIEFPLVRSELAVFLGDSAVLEDRIEEANEEWERGVAGIRRRVELDEIDGKEALRSATKLANRIRRGFVAWLGEN